MSVVPFAEARRIVEEHARAARATAPEPVELLAARGRVLAEEIAADRDFPPFPRATRDGFALRAADLGSLPARLRVTGEIRAGAPLDPALQVGRGEAVSIMTGAAVPPGSDAVVMVEFTESGGGYVEI